MKAIGIIPARYASTRFPGKPLASILGKTLLHRTYDNALKAKSLEEVIIATDDIRIFEHAQQFGAKAVMTSQECPTGTDRIQEVLEKEKNLFSDIIVNIQGDEPCIDPLTIDKIVDCLANDLSAVIATPIAKILNPEDASNPSIVKCVKSAQDNALYFSRALIPAGRTGEFRFDINYYRHIGIYAYRREFLPKYRELNATPLQLAEDLEQLKVLEYGYKIKVAVVESTNIEVNEPEDIQKVEQYLCKQNLSS